MGFREAVLFGFVLLLSGGNPWAATQNWSNLSTDEPLNQIPQEQVTTSLQLQRADRGSNRTKNGGPVRSPVTYRLKVHQLWNPAVRKQTPPRPLVEQMHTSQNQQRWEASVLTLQQPNVQSVLLKLVQGPDLNPPVKPESKVQTLMLEQRVPVPADSVAARCGEGEVTVEVKQNFLERVQLRGPNWEKIQWNGEDGTLSGNGQLIRPSDLTLGGCAALDTARHILRFQTELPGCGSTVRMTEETLIYSFSLMYSPTPIGNTFIFKTNPAEVVIECHYRRRLYASSGAVRPTWTPFASSMSAEQRLHFSLRLMTEDWQSQRPSSVYFLSDVMHIEAAVLGAHHVPLRVYADSCVATMTPDPNSQPRYPFISNHGCLSDAKLTGAKSYFMQRSREDKLHFQLKALAFHHDHRNSLYITCHLRATKVSVPIDWQHKVCSFLTEANRWVASGGDNEVCGCCETSCSEQRQKRSLAADVDLQWEGTVALGPILLVESILLEELTELSQLQTQEVTRAASHLSTALLCGVGAALAVLLLVFIGAIIRSRRHKPTGHFVCT